MTSNSHRLSRRRYLTSAGAAATIGLAGCVDLGGTDEIALAHMPIFPDLQYYVMEDRGYFDDVDATIENREFTDGPAIVQAYGSGELDVALVGIVPSMIVVDRGLPAKVTAANIKEPNAIMAHEEFQALWDEHGSDAFGVWEEERGRKFRFGTFPQGSTPDVLLRYWLREDVGVDPEETVEITEIGGANALWQAIANGEIDGASALEPVLTRAEQEEAPVRLFRTAGDIMPGQPGAVVVMSDEVRNSDTATQFLEQHIRATEFIRDNPEATADVIEEGIGMDADRALSALRGPLANFVTDPHEIENGTEIFAEFAHGNDQIDDRLSLDEIFDHSVYESL